VVRTFVKSLDTIQTVICGFNYIFLNCESIGWTPWISLDVLKDM
jgi:hypothetical protein